MAILQPKVVIIYDTANTLYLQIQSFLQSNGINPKMLLLTAYQPSDIVGYDIAILMPWSSYNSTVKGWLKSSFDTDGINMIECTSSASNTVHGDSLAVMFGLTTSSAALSNNEKNLILNDVTGIAKESGLKTDGVTGYNFRSASYVYSYYTVIPSVIPLYTREGGNKEVKAMLATKGTTTNVYPSTKAHYAALTDFCYNGTGATLSNDALNYFYALINFFAARYKIKGTVKDSTGTPLERDLYLYYRSNGTHIGTIKSKPDGTFEQKMSSNNEIFIVAKSPDSSTEPSVVYDKIVPTVIL